jgi:hypothetical protein
VRKSNRGPSVQVREKRVVERKQSVIITFGGKKSVAMVASEGGGEETESIEIVREWKGIIRLGLRAHLRRKSSQSAAGSLLNSEVA